MVHWTICLLKARGGDTDVMKQMMSDYTVEPINHDINEFNVKFHGPKEIHTNAEFQWFVLNFQMSIPTSLF